MHDAEERRLRHRTEERDPQICEREDRPMALPGRVNGAPSIWRLYPHAALDDARWQDHPIWGEVVVRADTAAEARRLAARLDEDPASPPTGNEMPSRRSGFEDEKLYWAARLSEAETLAYEDTPGPVLVSALFRPGS